eukprot:6395624-Ditylum_brightwellii.AAC.1
MRIGSKQTSKQANTKEEEEVIITQRMQQSNIYHQNKQRVRVPTVTQCHSPVRRTRYNFCMARMRLMEGVASVATSIAVVFSM